MPMRSRKLRPENLGIALLVASALRFGKLPRSLTFSDCVIFQLQSLIEGYKPPSYYRCITLPCIFCYLHKTQVNAIRAVVSRTASANMKRPYRS